MRTVKQRQTFRDKRGGEGGREGGRGMIWSSIS